MKIPTIPYVVEIIYHYPASDDGDCGGDYWDVEVRFDGKLVLELGSYYDDKSDDHIKGFLAGFEYATGEELPEPFIKHVADRSY